MPTEFEGPADPNDETASRETSASGVASSMANLIPLLIRALNRMTLGGSEDPNVRAWRELQGLKFRVLQRQVEEGGRPVGLGVAGERYPTWMEPSQYVDPSVIGSLAQIMSEPAFRYVETNEYQGPRRPTEYNPLKATELSW